MGWGLTGQTVPLALTSRQLATREGKQFAYGFGRRG
jgi:hypothetical protein